MNFWGKPLAATDNTVVAVSEKIDFKSLYPNLKILINHPDSRTEFIIRDIERGMHLLTAEPKYRDPLTTEIPKEINLDLRVMSIIENVREALDEFTLLFAQMIDSGDVVCLEKDGEDHIRIWRGDHPPAFSVVF